METISPKDTFVHSRRYQLILWSAAVAIILLGIYLTGIRFMNHEWISRSGCAVVMLGIWSGLGVIVQERILAGQIRWRRRNALIRARARFNHEQSSADELDKEIGEISQAFDNQSAELTQKLKLSLGVLEVSLLITGTFLWGFGDLFTV